MDITITSGITDIVVYLVEDFESSCPTDLTCASVFTNGNHILFAEVFINYDKNWSDGVCGVSGGSL
jgi:hypothetical protein